MINYLSHLLESIVSSALAWAVLNLLVWAGLAIFMGATPAREAMVRFYRWLARKNLDVLKAVALSAGFFVCAMATVWLLGIVRIN
jgi:uncharacterized membrane protein YesL